MISHLKGTLTHMDEKSAVIDVMGIGFEVLCSAKTLSQLEVGREMTVLIELQVREQDMVMYGFVDASEKHWFKKLVSVQGVGGRVALAVLSALDIETLTRALTFGEKEMITRADGVGPKLAARIITELKDKALDGPSLASSAVNTDEKSAPVAAMGGSMLADAISALSNLGYSRDQAAQMVQKVLDKDSEDNLDTIIKKALRG